MYYAVCASTREAAERQAQKHRLPPLRKMI
ncbi:MAG: hypothetical protein M0C28_09275 [Candidatus Moduliflexus flocculans]|nr:hypothetical protein [Candidatus Moduliflexus flocculans]